MIDSISFIKNGYGKNGKNFLVYCCTKIRQYDTQNIAMFDPGRNSDLSRQNTD